MKPADSSKKRSIFWAILKAIRLGIRPHKAPKPHPKKLQAWKCAPTPSTGELYVVWDAMGDGRLVGVFSCKNHAEQIRMLNPHYYRYYQCSLNSPDPMAISWLEEPTRTSLKELCAQFNQPGI